MWIDTQIFSETLAVKSTASGLVELDSMDGIVIVGPLCFRNPVSVLAVCKTTAQSGLCPQCKRDRWLSRLGFLNNHVYLDHNSFGAHQNVFVSHLAPGVPNCT